MNQSVDNTMHHDKIILKTGDKTVSPVPGNTAGINQMATVIAVHSFRGGTGKSNTTANLAAIYAMEGRRVGIVDTDIQSPGLHVLFGVPVKEVRYSINDYLWGKCTIDQTAREVTAILPGAGALK